MGWLCLMTLLSRREREHAAHLYRTYYPVLYRRCQRLLQQEDWIDDAMQDIFWTICRRQGQYRGEADAILPWLYRIATTHCLRLLERKQRLRERVTDAMEEGADRYAACFSEVDVERRVLAQELLERLPPLQRQAVIYRYVDGLTQREIASVMEVTRDQVRTWLSLFQAKGQSWLASDDAGGAS